MRSDGVVPAAIIQFMHKFISWRLWMPLFVVLLACRAVTPVAPPPTTQVQPVFPGAAFTPGPFPSATVTAPATATYLPIPSATGTPTQDEFIVRFHPDGGLYVGDQVSIEVISPPGVEMADKQVRVTLDGVFDTQVGFGAFGIAGRMQATILWVWDTTDLAPGDYQLTFSIEPDGPAWTETVPLFAQADLPFPGMQAAWAVAESDCCLVNYITKTASERDLDMLLDTLDDQAMSAVRQMGVELSEPIQVTFVPRVLGHGGFATDGVWISYLDRNYTGSNSGIVFHHEMIHVLDRRLGGELRPSLLVEGLAVYLSGGHFKREALIPRAAALLPSEPGCLPYEEKQTAWTTEQEVCGLGQYIPLVPLVDGFYDAQHEIGYLQAGALVEYMIVRWGWEAFSAFYRDIHNQPTPTEVEQEIGGPQYQAIHVALQEHFGVTFEQLEADFLDNLSQIKVTLEAVQDVRMTTLYYDTIRRYQQLLDPSAYFATAWLLDGEQMREQGIVADYLRAPLEDENLALEMMLLTANQDFLETRFIQVENLLKIINQVLDRQEQKDAQPFGVHPLAQDYLLLVKAARQAGYIPQRISVENNIARVWGNSNSPELVELLFDRQMQGWQLVASGSSNLLWATE